MNPLVFRAAKRYALTLLTVMSIAPSRLIEGQSAPDFAVVDSFVTRVMAVDRLPGASLAIVHNGRIVHARGFGVDGYGRPVTESTGFTLGSMSKAFTALAMMQLVDSGRVMLDAPVQQYLPWFRVADSAASAQITVRQLLLHTSGIPTGAPRATGDALTLADHVRALARTKLSHPPGTAHEYASPNYQVLGAIIETVTGVSFAVYVERSIFAPLAMRKSYAESSRAIAGGMARGHVYVLGFPRETTLRFESDRLPTAALISSAEDMAHFLIAHLNGGLYEGNRIASITSMEAMHAGRAPSDGFSYAFGWRDGRIAGVRAVNHGGITPNFRGKMVLLPDSGWGVVVLTNASSAIPMPITPTSHRLADDIAAYLVGTPLPPPTSSHRTRWLALAAVMLAVLVGQLRGVWKLWRTRAPLARGRAWLLAAFDMAVVTALVIIPPRMFGVPWSELPAIAPDIALWLLLVSALGVTSAVMRVRRA